MRSYFFKAMGIIVLSCGLFLLWYPRSWLLKWRELARKIWDFPVLSISWRMSPTVSFWILKICGVVFVVTGILMIFFLR